MSGYQIRDGGRSERVGVRLIDRRPSLVRLARIPAVARPIAKHTALLRWAVIEDANDHVERDPIGGPSDGEPAVPSGGTHRDPRLD